MTELREHCHRCGTPLPFAHENQMVGFVPGVGTFHADCMGRLTLREWLLHRAYRLLTPKPKCAGACVGTFEVLR
jgi:hypothetical protein